MTPAWGVTGSSWSDGAPFLIMEIEMNTKLNKLALAIGVVIMSGTVAAATATQNLSVSAEIAASCEFGTAASLPFGALTVSDLANGKSETTAAAVKITCTNTGTAAKLYGGATRQMVNGTNGTTLLAYQVYTNAGRTTALGTAAGDGASVTADGTEQTVTLYGQTASGQGGKASGSYSQALALTVEF